MNLWLGYCGRPHPTLVYCIGSHSSKNSRALIGYRCEGIHCEIATWKWGCAIFHRSNDHSNPILDRKLSNIMRVFSAERSQCKQRKSRTKTGFYWRRLISVKLKFNFVLLRRRLKPREHKKPAKVARYKKSSYQKGLRHPHKLYTILESTMFAVAL